MLANLKNNPILRWGLIIIASLTGFCLLFFASIYFGLFGKIPTEGIAATSAGKLWITVKEKNLDNSSGYKGVYEYDPQTKELRREPVLKIRYDDPKFERLKTHNPRKLLRPSDLAIHPVSGHLYILDAEFQKVVITNSLGEVLSIHLLDPAEFEQPEGIAFSKNGRIFIANERVGQPANIREIKFLN